MAFKQRKLLPYQRPKMLRERRKHLNFSSILQFVHTDDSRVVIILQTEGSEMSEKLETLSYIFICCSRWRRNATSRMTGLENMIDSRL